MKLSTFILILSGFTVLANPCPSFQETYQNKTFTSGKNYSELPSDSQLEQWMEDVARIHNVNPNFLKAVAHIESRKGNKKFRCGKMGKTYYGPMGIHKCFISRWNIADPYTNIKVGANALRGVGSNPVAQKKRLRRYNNTAWSEAYWRAVKLEERNFAKGLK